MLAALLFLQPFYSYGSKEFKNSKIETKNMTHIDVPDVIEHREAGELTDNNDYSFFPLCGDKPIHAWANGFTYTCYCGNRTLSSHADLRDGDFYCCVPPSESGQDQCTGGKYSDVRCKNGELRHRTEPCYQKCWNSYRQSEKLWKTATLYCLKEDYCLPLDQMLLSEDQQ